MPRRKQKQYAAPKTAPKAVKKDHKTVRAELNRKYLAYRLIHDCLQGEDAVKGIEANSMISYIGNPAAFNGGGSGSGLFYSERAKLYLPMPNPEDDSPQNRMRYASYVQRAVFYNVTSRTLDGMIGQVFLIPPVKKLPPRLAAVDKNSDGQGTPLDQSSKKAVRLVCAYGRAGLFVDYDKTDAPATIKDITDGKVQPVIRVIQPWNIINWRTTTVGTKTYLSLVVIREVADEESDQFNSNEIESYRILKLDEDGDYYQIKITDDGEEEIYPQDSKGKFFKYIPFQFIGSENNDPSVDKPPMFDLAKVNIAHYRNSADVEESSFIVGQPTLAVAGLTQDWWEKVLNKQFHFGSRGGIPLPAGAKAEILQINSNTLPRELMKDKEDQMVAIGAKLVIQKRVQKTATEAIVDSSSESSVLSNCSSNVGAAYELAIGWCCDFTGADKTDLKYELNKDFELNRMTPDDLAKLVANWQKGAITWSEMRQGLRKAGQATLDDKEALELVKEEHAELVQAGLIADPFGDVTQPSASPDPNNDPSGHAKKPATRGQ